MQNEEKLAVLGKAARALNAANVTWAVGASALLYLEGLAEEFNDFDLLITSPDMGLARDALEKAGAKAMPSAAPSATYATAQFAEFALDNVDFDLLCDFAIRRKDAVYRYPFDQSRVARIVTVSGEPTPLAPLADWYVLYLLMPGRAKRANLVGRYLRANPRGDTRPCLSRWLSDRLPGEVRECVMSLFYAQG